MTRSPTLRHPHAWLLVGALAVACTNAADSERTPAPPLAAQASEVSSEGAAELSFEGDVLPVLESRCVVCHSCYDAPCQLRLGSYEGIERGASPDAVYDAARLAPQTPTRLGVDAHGEAAWRELGFHDVLRGESGASGGLMLGMLALGRAASFRPGERLPADFPLGIQRELVCPSAGEFADYAEQRPQGGMPYGMAPLAKPELDRLVRWVREGAPAPPSPPALPAAVSQQVESWERFLNGVRPKDRLTARYLYEHWFVSHLYFRSHPAGPFFRAVRSSTPPGQPVREIATRRPYDSPGKEPFWYRLEPIRETIVHKTHIVYALDAARLERLRELFLAGDWQPSKLPPYGHATGSNPFVTFAELPARARYQFLLDDAHHFVTTFIRGPVCHGQVAVDVIEDHFWVAFLEPDYDLSVTDPAYLEAAKELLDLPAEQGSLALPGGLWADHAAHQVRYLRMRRKAYAATDPQKLGPPLDAIWDGEGQDRDALLTVFRHFDNATVVHGLVGAVPETAWVIDYPIFERIYYDLVAGFDVFGNVAHQAATRLYMDHLRMQSENLLLAFLPETARKPLRDSWYRGATDEFHQSVINRPQSTGHGTQVRFESDDYVGELFAQLRARNPEVAGPEDLLNRCAEPPCARAGASPFARRVEAALQPLAGVRGPWVRHLPELSWLLVREGAGTEAGLLYALIHDRAHTNVASMFGEEDRLEPELDQVTLVRGPLGSYPNFLFEVSAADLEAFRTALLGVRDAAGFEALAARFGVRRSDPRIWRSFDWIHADFARRAPTEAGLFDLNRYENR